MKTEPINAESYRLTEFEFRPISGRRYVVFDVEATGPDHETDCVTQIGAVAVYDDGPSDGESFNCLVRPQKQIPAKIEALTGVTNSLVASASSFATVWPSFLAFCGESALVTQCGYEFDFPLLDRECARSAVPPLVGPRVDTKALFALRHRGRFDTFSTNLLSEHYGVDRSLFRRHDALGDAKLIARIFHAMLRESQHLNECDWSLKEPICIKRFVLPPL
jgi:DNA polymerase-3 subunit epsilon